MTGPEGVAPEERPAFHAWRLLLRTHASLVAGLDAALRAEAGVPLAWYDLLVHVGEAPGREIRLRELEDRVFFSQSTVSRLAARLERAGHLERAVPPDDRRGVLVRLTPGGLDLLRSARAVAVRYVRGAFVEALGPGDAERLVEILRRTGA